jgi:hypothetical protein
MAEYKQQQQDHRAGLQHLAHLQQEDSAAPAVLIHQQQGSDHNRLVEALVAVQDLERQRLGQLTQDQVGGQLQFQQHQQS